MTLTPPPENSPRPIPGDSPAERAVAIAGALAELGVTSLLLRDDSGERELRARRTNLPGEILRSARGVLLARGVRIDFDQSSATITPAADPPA